MKSRNMKSGNNGKLNCYVDTDHSNSNISERELYETVGFQNKSKTDQSIHKCTNESKTKIETDDEDEVKYETVEETNRDRAARNIHMNESYQQYININENSNKVRRNLNQKSNDNGELYYNIDEQNSQEYETPMRTESAPHLYSKLNANSEKDNIKSDTQVLEKTEEEYEFMMSQ